MSARSVAYDVLRRVDDGGSYANLALAAALDSTTLPDQDRRFCTQLVYGTTRMRRACDFLVDRFIHRAVDPEVRTALRLGAYQLHYLATPAHAAVAETVSLVSRRSRGFVNAVLRRLSTADDPKWPDDATRLSYPDWIVDLLTRDLGPADAVTMLERMNREPNVHVRTDGYVQDPASAWVCELVGARAGQRILDTCAAPGGKTTLLSAAGARLVAVDRRLARARLVERNARRTGTDAIDVVVADGRALPCEPNGFDAVLVDAPCSGLGVLRRRPDARWRIDAPGVARLAALQRDLLAAATDAVRVGGRLVYSVCTVTRAETAGVASVVDDRFEPVDVPAIDARWRPLDAYGGLVLPHDHDTDGMAAFVWHRTR